MNGSMRQTGAAGAFTAEPDAGSDYRVREVEARLDRRIAAVEADQGRTNWAARIAGAGFLITLTALVIVMVTVLPGDAGWAVDSLSTHEVVLRDADGIERGRLSTDAEGRAQLSLSDRDGRERIRLAVLADGSPGVTINDPEARPRAVLAYLGDGTTNLVFADAQGVSRAVFGLEPDGSAQALFSDRDGVIRTLVGVGSDGDPSVSVFEEEAVAGGSNRP